nr:hypothetical protein [Cytophagales bacterium]
MGYYARLDRSHLELPVANSGNIRRKDFGSPFPLSTALILLSVFHNAPIRFAFLMGEFFAVGAGGEVVENHFVSECLPAHT